MEQSHAMGMLPQPSRLFPCQAFVAAQCPF